jgi:hypothetical protein
MREMKMPARTGTANQTQSIIEGDTYHAFVSGERKEGAVGDEYWVTWVKDADTHSFSYKSGDTLITLRRETRAKGQFWYAYKKLSNKLHKVYVGKSEDLTVETLNVALAALREKISGRLQGQTTPNYADDKLPKVPDPVTPVPFLADYKAEPTRKQVPFGFTPGEAAREVLAVIAAGLVFSPNHKEGIRDRKLARHLAGNGLLAEVTQDPDHRKHYWRLTEAGLTLIRKDEDLQQRVKRWTAMLD